METESCLPHGTKATTLEGSLDNAIPDVTVRNRSCESNASHGTEISNDLTDNNVDKHLHSVLEYTSKIKAFVGLDDSAASSLKRLSSNGDSEIGPCDSGRGLDESGKCLNENGGLDNLSALSFQKSQLKVDSVNGLCESGSGLDDSDKRLNESCGFDDSNVLCSERFSTNGDSGNGSGDSGKEPDEFGIVLDKFGKCLDENRECVTASGLCSEDFGNGEDCSIDLTAESGRGLVDSLGEAEKRLQDSNSETSILNLGKELVVSEKCLLDSEKSLHDSTKQLENYQNGLNKSEKLLDDFSKESRIKVNNSLKNFNNDLKPEDKCNKNNSLPRENISTTKINNESNVSELVINTPTINRLEYLAKRVAAPLIESLANVGALLKDITIEKSKLKIDDSITVDMQCNNLLKSDEEFVKVGEGITNLGLEREIEGRDLSYPYHPENVNGDKLPFSIHDNSEREAMPDKLEAADKCFQDINICNTINNRQSKIEEDSNFNSSRLSDGKPSFGKKESERSKKFLETEDDFGEIPQNESSVFESQRHDLLQKQGFNEQPNFSEIRRLSSEVVGKVLDAASIELQDLGQATHIIPISETITCGEQESFESEEENGDSSETQNGITERHPNNNNEFNEISLKEVLSKDYDCGESQKKIDSVANEIDCSSDLDPDTICGIGCLRPKWMQRYATARVYLVLYSIIGILSGSYYTYLIGCMSTLEKRFAFKSKISGSIMMLDEITPLFLGVLIGYFGGKMHRPRLVGFGMMLSAMACFVSALPYFIYGPVTHLTTTGSLLEVDKTGYEICEDTPRDEECDADDLPPTLAAILFLMLGSFLKGFGNLAYYAIGLVYMDDNAKKKNTPMYLAIAMSLRLLGPVLGFLMSSYFLKFYENPFDTPDYGSDDPRWIGGWWMGFMLQGLLLMICAIPISMFPRRLPGHKPSVDDKNGESHTFKEHIAGLFAALGRLAKNPFFLILSLDTIFGIFGSFGHYIMLPRYMEYQFKLSASNASLLSGPPALVAIIISTIIGGYIIWKYKPSARLLLAGMATLEMIGAVGYLLLMIPKCQNPEMIHYGTHAEGLLLESECNAACSCSTTGFTPVCGSDGTSLFFSPCYAGCAKKINQNFTNCSCLSHSFVAKRNFVTEGFCVDDGCWTQAVGYVVALVSMNGIVCLLRVAHSMILLRSIKPEDKSVALGAFETLICTFGFIPYPLMFGALVDSACLVWEKTCGGQTGNCWFYDVPKFNYLLHGASSGFSFVAFLCLITLYLLSDRVYSLYEEDENSVQKYHKKETSH